MSNSFKSLTFGIKFKSQNKKLKKVQLKNEAKPIIKLLIDPELDNFKDTDDPFSGSDEDFMENTVEMSGDEFDEDFEVKEEPDEDVEEEVSIVPKKIKKPKMFTEKQLQDQETVRINILRKKHKISYKGVDVPTPISTFEEFYEKFNISEQLQLNMKDIGYETPTPIQMQALPVLMQNKSLKACAPTGSGKTTAFLLPMIQNIILDNEAFPTNAIKGLIIVPTRELATQILRECVRICDKTNVRAHIITKTDDSMKNFHNKKTNILIATPNRVSYMIRQNLKKFKLNSVKWIVIDEVDKMFEESDNGFLDELKTILEACNNPEKKFGLFSATTSPSISKWAYDTLKDYATVKIGITNSAISSVDQKLVFTGTESGKLMAFRNFIKTGVYPPVLVFVQSKDRAQQLFTELIYEGLNIDVIHSDRSQKERDLVVKKFREGKVWFLICTELLSRGLDFKGVNVVVNYDFPQSTTSYIHRIGRCGRAGRLGKSVTFFTNEDKPYLRDVAKLIKQSGGEVPEYLLTLKKSTKKDRVKLLKKAVKRKAIRTLPQFEVADRKRKKKFVTKSKAKKLKTE